MAQVLPDIRKAVAEIKPFLREERTEPVIIGLAAERAARILIATTAGHQPEYADRHGLVKLLPVSFGR